MLRPSTSEATAALAHAEIHAATQTSVLTQHKPLHLYIPQLPVTNTAQIIKAEPTACTTQIFVFVPRQLCCYDQKKVS